VVDRVPGAGRYARPESEQRWVLWRLPDELREPVAVVDRYLHGTRLRLRRIRSATEVIYKLGQKVRTDPLSPALVHLTNMYLSDGEYRSLSQLSGEEICKEVALGLGRADPGRRRIRSDSRRYDPGRDRVEPGRTATPTSAVGDVTDDDRFSGDRLATTTSGELQSLLALIAAEPTS